MRVIGLAVAFLACSQPAQAGSLGLPINCQLGRECFIQQTPDVDPGDGVRDSFCGLASYDGHKGWDFRVPTLRDMERGYDVTAALAGTVLRVRDGVPDRIVANAADRAAVGSQECGNGLVISHDGGIETQYCHLRQGSVRVKPGDVVAKGDRLGLIGASGLAAFPHIHLTVRDGRQAVDPLSGLPLSQESSTCGPTDASLFEDTALEKIIAAETTTILGVGLTGVRPTSALLVAGNVPQLRSTDEATLGWVWAINVPKDARLAIKVSDSRGATIAQSISESLPRHKASYHYFSGRKFRPKPGSYTVEAVLILPSGREIRRITTADVE